MKKTTIALAIAVASFATVVQAAPQDNSWYAGAKLGWSNYHDTKFYDSNSGKGDKNQLGAGAYLGYQANQYIGFELGYDWLGRMKYGSPANDIYHSYRAQGIQLAAKLSYPITNDLDIYTRLGGFTWRAESKVADQKNSDYGLSPLAAAGLEYAITPNIATRLDYQWINNVGDGDEIGVRPDNMMLSVGVAYRFGAAEAVPVIAPLIVPEVETKRFALKSDVLFNFGKNTLKDEGRTALDLMFDQLKNIHPTSGNIVVIGHTDRIGSDNYNLKLSEQRAQHVVDYLVSKGIPSDRIAARGVGKAEPITGNVCDKIRARTALVDCLAPDRRVDIEVTGTVDVLSAIKSVSNQF